MRKYNEISEFERIDREEFIKKVICGLSEKLEDVTITRREQLKNNSTRLEGITIRKESSEIAPTIYLNSYYERYADGAPFYKLLDEILQCYNASLGECCPEPKLFCEDAEEISKKIFYRLINREANEELLSGVPHREYLDFAITYHWFVPSAGPVFGSVLITNDIANRFGWDEQKLFDLAGENTPSIFKFQLRTMGNVIGSMLEVGEGGLPPMFGDIENYPMYVVSNDTMSNGASVLLYSELRQQLSEIFPEGYYVLPSSIHELIVLPKQGNDPDNLLDMIYEVNITQVPEEEFLSDNLYCFSPEKNEFEVIYNAANIMD